MSTFLYQNLNSVSSSYSSNFRITYICSLLELCEQEIYLRLNLFAIGHINDMYLYEEGLQGEDDPQPEDHNECSIVGKSLLFDHADPTCHI